MSPKQSQYFQDLKNPQWQKKRLEIMNRDEFTCQDCYTQQDELQVHHKVYTKDAKPWEYDNSNLVTLCKSCHESRKKLMEEVKAMMEHRGITAIRSIHNLLMNMQNAAQWDAFESCSVLPAFCDIIESIQCIEYAALKRGYAIYKSRGIEK